MFREAIDWAGMLIDGAGVLVLVGGIAITTLLSLVRGGIWSPEGLKTYRQNIGRVILLGLEILVAGDIIRTVAVDPTPSNVGVLGGIVLIRTLLSLSLQIEIEQRLPWHSEKPEPGRTA